MKDIKFAFIGHGNGVESMHKYFSKYRQDYSQKKINDKLLLKLWDWTPSFKAQDFKIKKKIDNSELEGMFVAATFVPEMLIHSREKVIKKIEDAIRVCEENGATVATLGAFNSIADGQQGEIVARAAKSMHVTNGTTFTAAMVIEGINKSAEILDINLKESNLTVVGATGSIGRVCSEYFMGKVNKLILTGRSASKLEYFYGNELNYNDSLELTTDNNSAVAEADFVICVTSAINSLFESDAFKPGAVVSDVGFPKNISKECIDRPDLLVYSGGTSQVPAKFDDFEYSGAINKNILYGCFSESMLIAMEGCYEYCKTGVEAIPLENVEYLLTVAEKHGFKVAPFYNDDRFYTEEDFDYIRGARQNALKEMVHA